MSIDLKLELTEPLRRLADDAQSLEGFLAGFREGRTRELKGDVTRGRINMALQDLARDVAELQSLHRAAETATSEWTPATFRKVAALKEHLNSLEGVLYRIAGEEQVAHNISKTDHFYIFGFLGLLKIELEHLEDMLRQ